MRWQTRARAALRRHRATAAPCAGLRLAAASLFEAAGLTDSLPVLCRPAKPLPSPAPSDAPLPAHVPVYEDVFSLGGGNHKNFYWFEADTGGYMAFLAPFLRAFPSAVIHVGTASAKLWGPMHAGTLALWGIHPSRVVFGTVLARRAHLLDKPGSGRPHPLAAGACGGPASAVSGLYPPPIR